MKYSYIRLQPIRADVTQQNNISLSGISHQEQLSGFELYLLKSGRKPNTVKIHTDHLSRLLKHVPDLSPQQIETFLADLKRSGRKASYINDYIDTLRIYGRFLQTDVFTSLTYFKEEEFIKATLSNEEIEAFLNCRRRQ